jgi:putative endonuclease
MKGGFVYIMSNKHRTTFYIGVTSNLKTRIADHKNGIGSEFTKKYKLTDLLYYEDFPDIYQAIDREKQLKNWHKQWKINLIKSANPAMNDLFWEIR